MANIDQNKLTIDAATARKFGLPIGDIGKEIDSNHQDFTKFQTAIACDIAYYQKDMLFTPESCRSRSESIGDDSVFSGDRYVYEKVYIWISRQ